MTTKQTRDYGYVILHHGGPIYGSGWTIDEAIESAREYDPDADWPEETTPRGERNSDEVVMSICSPRMLATIQQHGDSDFCEVDGPFGWWLVTPEENDGGAK